MSPNQLFEIRSSEFWKDDLSGGSTAVLEPGRTLYENEPAWSENPLCDGGDDLDDDEAYFLEDDDDDDDDLSDDYDDDDFDDDEIDDEPEPEIDDEEL